MTVAEAAAYLELSVHTVRAMCRKHNPILAHTRVGPRHGRILISKEECDRHRREGAVERGRPEQPRDPRRPMTTGTYVCKHLTPKPPG